MHKTLHDVIEVLKRRIARSHHRRSAHTTSQESYRSSRDTAARALRGQDVELLGLPVEGQDSKSLIGFFARR
jgi:ribose 5-phosphate isomerase